MGHSRRAGERLFRRAVLGYWVIARLAGKPLNTLKDDGFGHSTCLGAVNGQRANSRQVDDIMLRGSDAKRIHSVAD